MTNKPTFADFEAIAFARLKLLYSSHPRSLQLHQ